MEEYNFAYFIYDLILTISAYMIIPTIYKLFTKENISKKKANIISIINAIIIAVFFIILKEALGGDGSEIGFAVIFYYFINVQMLQSEKGTKVPTIVLSCICIMNFLCGLFYAFVIFWPIALIALISIIVKIVMDKNNSKISNKTKIIKKEQSNTIKLKCSNCNHLVNESDWFCSNCGEQFDETDEECLQHQKEKRKKDVKRVSEVIDEERVVVGNKANYCKLCGGKLTSEKKCTKCGKQYFYIKNKSILIIIPLLIFLALSIFINIKFYNKNEILSDDNWELYMENKRLEEENEEIHSNLFSVIGTNSVYYTKEKLSFLDENIVFVLEGYGNKYWTYDCVQQITNGEEYSFWAYNINAAKGQGYKKGTC